MLGVACHVPVRPGAAAGVVRRLGHRVLLVALAAGLTASFQPAGAAAGGPGSLDRSFAGDGKKLFRVFGPNPKAHASALQGDGKIVIAGVSKRMALLRLRPGGKVDRKFGDDGRVKVEYRDNLARAHALAVQGNGKILVGGESQGGAALARLRRDGSLDRRFSGNGKFLENFAEPIRTTNDVQAIAVQDDGKIVTAGTINTGRTDAAVLILRLTRKGKLDPSFADDGVLITDFGTDARSEANALAIQPDGRIVIAGEVQNNWMVARFLPDGTPDTSFDEDGLKLTAPLAIGHADALVLQPDGKILTGGCERGDFDRARFGLVRYLADGTPDPSFGNGGAFHDADFGSEIENACAAAMALQDDGDIVLAGLATKRRNTEFFAVARYLTDGSLDETFKRDGTAITGFRNRIREEHFTWVDDRATGLVIQPRGRIIATGYDVVVRRPDAFAVAAFRGG